MSRIPAIDPDCCIGCEVCTQVCPEVFCMEEGEGDDHGDHHCDVDQRYPGPVGAE